MHIKFTEKGTRGENWLSLPRRMQRLSCDRTKIVSNEKKDAQSGAMKEIAGWLDLPDLVRVEAYDISNISGFESVGSIGGL